MTTPRRTGVPRISPIRLVSQGVVDLERTVAFYGAAFAFVDKGRGVIDAGDMDLARAWRLPPGLTGRFAIVGPASTDGPMLRLIEFARPGQPIWGNYETKQDQGLFAVNYRIPEIRASWERLMAAGARARSTPMHWTILDGIGAWESQVIDPDGTLLDVFEMTGEKTPEIFGGMAALCEGVETVALHSNDADRCKAFYMGLGYGEFYDHEFAGLENLIHLPAGTKLRNVNLWKRELSRMGRVEIASYVGFPGASNRERAVPPNTGPLAICFETDDVDAALALACDLGGEFVGGPATMALPVFGPVRLGTVYGPDGEMVEFFQPLKA